MIIMTQSENALTRENLMNEIETSWNELQTYLASLTEEQFTRPTDAAGWTVKDHVIHIAVWEHANLAMLEGKSKREVLEITPEVWEQDDDPINAVLQQRHCDMPLTEVMQTLNQNHERILNKLNTMTKADFQRPYSHYQPQSNQQRPIIDFVMWDTASHYRDHTGWIKAIVGSG
jgi:hypothetical protein